MVILTTFFDFLMFGAKNPRHNGTKLTIFSPFPKTTIYALTFHAENDLSSKF
jgi:hypothetical protein